MADPMRRIMVPIVRGEMEHQNVEIVFSVAGFAHHVRHFYLVTLYGQYGTIPYWGGRDTMLLREAQ